MLAILSTHRPSLHFTILLCALESSSGGCNHQASAECGSMEYQTLHFYPNCKSSHNFPNSTSFHLHQLLEKLFLNLPSLDILLQPLSSSHIRLESCVPFIPRCIFVTPTIKIPTVLLSKACSSFYPAPALVNSDLQE